MTRRRYYDDSTTIDFEARVVEVRSANGRYALVLDQTYFYPTSGGQPHDTGRLAGQAVLDVTIRETDGAILHWLAQAAPPVGTMVAGRVDWARRYDHMQHHTGQHILSQAFIRVAEAETVGFHLGEASVTIDLDDGRLTPTQIEQAEQLANEIIWEDRPVTVRYADREQLSGLLLRKVPDVDGQQLRLVEIADFDLTACGGTHVARTGAVGLVKVIKVDNHPAGLRIEFHCGQRALADYRARHEVVSRLANMLTTGYWELEHSVDRLREENKAVHRQVRQLQQRLVGYEADRLLAEGRQIGRVTLVSQTLDDDGQLAVRDLASHLAQRDGVIALLGVAGDRVQLVFSRAVDAPGQMNQLLQAALAALGAGRGGGSAQLAQGGGPAATREAVETAVGHAVQLLLAQLSHSAADDPSETGA